MAKRRKPHNPAAAQMARERMLTEEHANIAVRTGAEVRRDKGGRVTSIYRANVFTRLRDARSITENQYVAASVMIELWARARGLEGRHSTDEVIDGGSGSSDLVTDRMIEAGLRIKAILSQVGPLNARLISRFVAQIVETDIPMEWRLIVQEVCGCADPKKQVGFVVGALENLREVFEAPVRRAA